MARTSWARTAAGNAPSALRALRFTWTVYHGGGELPLGGVPGDELVAVVGEDAAGVGGVEPVLRFLREALEQAQVGNRDKRRELLPPTTDEHPLPCIRDAVDELRELLPSLTC